MPRDFKEIRALPRIRHQDSPQQVARVRGDPLGERERCRNNVLVEQIDVVSLRIRWIIVKRQITSQHSVLSVPLAKTAKGTKKPTKMTPQLHTSTFLPVYSPSLTTSSGAA